MMMRSRTVAWRKLRFRFDWTLTLAMLAMVALGLVNLWSALQDRGPHLFSKQISLLALGLGVFLAVAALDYRAISRVGYMLYGVGVFLLLAVLAFGRVVGGARRWFDLGPIHLQPSELMKVLIIVALGKYLNESSALEGRSFRHVAIPVAIVSLPVLMIARQPDLGTAFMIFLIFITVMLMARLRLKTLGAIMGLALISASPIWRYGLHEYQRKRVEALLNPASADAWQSRQALNAIGSGRFMGKGFLQATQIRIRRLPALWTDFPFAVWAEEWGFVGCLIVLAGYLVLILWILKIAGEARDRFGATVCVGVAAMLFWHVAVNVGMVIGILPVVGVTLPLISYGGSSVLTIMAALGLVMNVSIRRFAY
jgi:rod shape determining protein RodA